MDNLKPTHVLIVFLISLLSGLILGVTAWVMAGLAELDRSWIYGAGVLVLVTSGSWIFLVQRSLRILEAVLDIDLSGYLDDTPARVVIVDDVDRDRTEGMILHDLPGGEERFSRLAAGVMDGTPFAERYWTGDGKPYSLKEFREMRDYLLLRGVMSWTSEADHRQGIEIQPAGRALIRTFSQLTDHYLPTHRGNGGA